MLWFHVECTSLPDEHFYELIESNPIWECQACKDPELPELNSVNAVGVFYFDFQQNLPTPKLAVEKQFYLKIAVDLPIWCIFCFCFNYNSIHVA